MRRRSDKNAVVFGLREDSKAMQRIVREGWELCRPEVERGKRNESAGIADIGRGARIVWPHLPLRAHPITHLMSGQRH